jgi:type IV pilus assembly protein PilA
LLVVAAPATTLSNNQTVTFYRRNLPHLQHDYKPHFITFCTKHRRVLPERARTVVLENGTGRDSPSLHELIENTFMQTLIQTLTQTLVPQAGPWRLKCNEKDMSNLGLKRQRGFSRENGFSLLELLIVVGVILIIVAMAIPNLLRAKIAANESSAVQTVRQIATAELTYHTGYPAVGYAPDLVSLGGPASGCKPSPASACIVDSVVTSGSKSGYQLFAAGFASGGSITNTQFVASSAPRVFNQTGARNFCIATDDGALRAKVGAPGGTPAPDVPTCIAYPLM